MLKVKFRGDASTEKKFNLSLDLLANKIVLRTVQGSSPDQTAGAARDTQSV